MVLCGRYEGVDERVREHLATEELSIGDYVLTGGELPALVMVDAVARLLPGRGRRRAVGRGGFVQPRVARLPALHAAGRVPRASRCRTCCSRGTTREIRRWRKRAGAARTLARRPDLLAAAELDDEEREILRELMAARQKEIDDGRD